MDYVNAIILREYYQNNDPDAIHVTEENVHYLSSASTIWLYIMIQRSSS